MRLPLLTFCRCCSWPGTHIPAARGAPRCRVSQAVAHFAFLNDAAPGLAPYPPQHEAHPDAESVKENAQLLYQTCLLESGGWLVFACKRPRCCSALHQPQLLCQTCLLESGIGWLLREREALAAQAPALPSHSKRVAALVWLSRRCCAATAAAPLLRCWPPPPRLLQPQPIPPAAVLHALNRPPSLSPTPEMLAAG